jgi:hypothetical protein
MAAAATCRSLGGPKYTTRSRQARVFAITVVVWAVGVAILETSRIIRFWKLRQLRHDVLTSVFPSARICGGFFMAHGDTQNRMIRSSL